MELDNLKEVWKEQPIASPPADEAVILSMLQKKSQSPIAKMRRNLLKELITIIILYTATIAYYFTVENGRLWQVGVMMLAVAILFFIYYYHKNKLLKQMECVTCEVRSNLQRQVSILEKYIRIYFLAGILLTPLAYFVAGMIVVYKSKLDFNLQNSLYWWFIGSGIAVSLLSYFLNKWYVNKLYGQHVRKLKELLKQTEETL